MSAERIRLAETIRAQAVALDLASAEAGWSHDGGVEVPGLAAQVLELEATLIPHGMHVVGEAMSDGERADMLASVNSAFGDAMLESAEITRIAAGETVSPRYADAARKDAAQSLEQLNADLGRDHELPAMIHALDAGYVRPVTGGDIIRTPSIVPTGRNLHGFDPFRLPSAHATAEGQRQAVMLLDRYARDHGGMPKSIALVMWGTDTLKSEGAPIGQALALIGARPRFDGFGRLAGAELMSLAELGRPRIDVVITLSGIFRDLLPLQTKLLAQACLMAAQADEPLEMNHIRAHALDYAREHNCDFETAALRVFSNASGAYGSNVNMLIDSGAWEGEEELAETYTRRKCFAYGVDGRPVRQEALLRGILGKVETAFQNIESVELGITSVDHYFDTLGGIARAVRESGGGNLPVYVGDQNAGRGKVRTLGEQVALETRTRMLNPKWYEGLLQHGYEGVRQIESHVTNTLGWSATTGQVEPWVYKNLTETFVLDETMRRRLSELNPKASSKLANRLIEAVERKYWNADEETLRALRNAGEELEDRVEGIKVEAAA
jgi:magnesium chelatase subunit H